MSSINMIRQWIYRNKRPGAALVFALAALFFLVSHLVALQSGKRDGQGQTAFNDSVAAGLLNQIAYGFESGNQEKVLRAFDLARMPQGQLFKQQIVSFFSHTESIRIHINLVQTSVENGKGTAEADVEMEAAPRGSEAPPVHKQDRLRFTAENTPAGWRFTDVQPPTFFSLQP